MSDLRERQMEAVRANEERTRREDEHRERQRAEADSSLNAKIRAAHANGRTKAEQTSTRHMNLPSNAKRGR